MFCLIVESMQVVGADGEITTENGDKFLVVKEPEGWVEATSISFKGRFDLDSFGAGPHGAKLFKTREAADAFAVRWNGHPWWCKPNGRFEIIEVEPVYEPVLKGYRRKPRA